VNKRLALQAAAIAWAALAGCAKDPTTIDVAVGIDATVPPLLILGIDVASVADPTRAVSSRLTSPYASDAADRPGPFLFPLLLPVSVDASLAGPVMVTVEGIDWPPSYAVIASGSAAATVVAQQSTSVDIVLTGTGAPTGDGGGDGAPGSDAGPD
jgi:hypothetical protein